MSFVVSMDQNISDVSGYSIYGEAIVGGEGSTWGDPDIDTGTDTSNNSYGYLPWGGNIAAGGLDTGGMGFELDANLATGQDILTVDDQAITYQGAPSGTVGSVEVRVAADVPATVSLDNISVKFFQGGTLQETESIPGLKVDTTDPSSSGTAENVLIVTPSSQLNDHVVIAGWMQMKAPDGTYPGSTDIFCQAFVKPAGA
jgi:hypothetical protein